MKKQIVMVERNEGVLRGYTEVLIGEKPSAETDEQQNQVKLALQTGLMKRIVARNHA